jgi:hypothetical protein
MGREERGNKENGREGARERKMMLLMGERQNDERGRERRMSK